MFWIFPDPGREKRISSSQESITLVPFQAVTSYVKIPEWGKHCSNRGMPFIVPIFGTIQGTWNERKVNPGALFGVQRISFRILPIVRYRGQAC